MQVILILGFVFYKLFLQSGCGGVYAVCICFLGKGETMSAHSGLRVRFRSFGRLMALVGVFCLLGGIYAQCAMAQKKESGAKIYHVPPSKIKAHIEKTKGRKRVLFIWRSDDEFSRRFLPEYSTLEKASPGTVISIATDKTPVQVMKYLNSIGERDLKTLVVKRAMGDDLNTLLSELGVKPFKEYPLVVTLDENNVVQSQGKLFVDYVVDYLFMGQNKKVQAP